MSGSDPLIDVAQARAAARLGGPGAPGATGPVHYDGDLPVVIDNPQAGDLLQRGVDGVWRNQPSTTFLAAGVHRGAWAAATAYKANDVVTAPNGHDYRATIAHTSAGTFNATNWMPLAGASAELPSLASVSQLARDGAWTWYNSPRAICYEGTRRALYTGYVSASGDVCVSSVDLDTGEFVETILHGALEADDHDNPALWMRPDGRLVCFYSKHAVDNTIRYRVASYPESVESFAAEQTISTGAGTVVTYANPVYLPSEGRLYLFTRITPTPAGVPDNPGMIYSDDQGVTWSSPVTYFDPLGNRPYVHFVDNGAGRIHFFASSGHPREITVGSGSMYHWYMEAGNFYKSDGTLIRSVASLSTTGYLTRAEVTKVYDATADKGSAVNGNAWPWSIVLDPTTGYPHVAFSVYSATNDNRYYWGRWTGTAWVKREFLANEPTLYSTTAEPQYCGGMSLDRRDPRIVYVSRKSGLSQWEIERWATQDDGVTWITQPITANSTVRNIRPFAPRYPLPGAPSVLWCRGDYTSYVAPNYNTGVFTSPRLPLTRPAPTAVIALDASTLGLANNDPVATWGVATQGTAGKQPLFKTNILNSLPGVLFDGVNDGLMIPALTLEPGPWTAFFVITPVAAAGLQYLFDAQTGRILLAQAHVAGTLGFNDGAWHDLGVAVTNVAQILTWDLGSRMTLFRDGVALATSTFASKALGGNIGLGQANDAGGAFWKGYMHEVRWFRRLTAGQRQTEFLRLKAKWATP